MAASIDGLAALPNAIISRPNYIPRGWGSRSTYLTHCIRLNRSHSKNHCETISACTIDRLG
jgi:hypothetical protein